MRQHVKGIRQERKAVCYIAANALNDHHRTGKDGNYRDSFLFHPPVDMLVGMVVMLIVACYLWVMTVFHNVLSIRRFNNEVQSMPISIIQVCPVQGFFHRVINCGRLFLRMVEYEAIEE